MRIRSAVAALLIAAPAASAQTVELPDGLVAAGDYLVRGLIQSAVQFARSQAYVTYEDIYVDLRAGTMGISGLKLRPDAPWDMGGDCEVRIGEVETAGRSDHDLGVARVMFSDVDAALSCLSPEPAAMLREAGYLRLTVDAMAVDYEVDAASGGLKLAVNAVVADVVEVDASADFAYFAFTGPKNGAAPPGATVGGGPPFVAELSGAEIVIADIGFIERAGPMLAGFIGGFEAAPPLVEGGLLDMLTEGGARPAPPGARAFAADARAAVEGFLTGGARIALVLDPPSPVRLSEDVANSPAAAHEALRASISGQSGARRALVAPELLAAALSGGALDDGERLTAGRALATGAGAPLAPERAVAALAPLVASWNAEAALLSARALAGRDAYAAYDHALIAAAGGAEGARALLDRLERRMTVAGALTAQAKAGQGWPGAEALAGERAAALDAADIPALRRLARAAARGEGRPRDVAGAYMLALVAAASGDRGAAALRDRIDRRLSSRGGADAAEWARRRDEIAAQALDLWLTGGLSERLIK